MTKKSLWFWNSTRGSAAIEFALVGVLFMVTLFGLIEVSRIFWTWNTLQSAVESGARYYLTHTDASDSALQALVREKVPGLNVPASRLTVTIDHSKVGNMKYIRIDGVYEYGPTIPHLFSSNLEGIRLSATARLAVP